jgi:predicted transcriptional regulator
MPKYRNNVQIVAAILEAASSGATKTKVMNRANLSYKQLSKYLPIAINHGLLTPGRLIVITKSGNDFLDLYRHFTENYSIVQKSISLINDEYNALEELISSAPRKK